MHLKIKKENYRKYLDLLYLKSSKVLSICTVTKSYISTLQFCDEGKCKLSLFTKLHSGENPIFFLGESNIRESKPSFISVYWICKDIASIWYAFKERKKMIENMLTWPESVTCSSLCDISLLFHGPLLNFLQYFKLIHIQKKCCLVLRSIQHRCNMTTFY